MSMSSAITSAITPMRLMQPPRLLPTRSRVPLSLSLSISHPRPHYPRSHYHSHQHATAPPFTPTEHAILSAALTHVPQHGFTLTSLTNGARQAGYLDITSNLFPTAAFALVHYHLITQRLALAQTFPSSPPPTTTTTTTPPPPPPNIPTAIKHLILHRLHANAPLLPHYPTALALLAHPPNLPTALTELLLLADEILHLAGSTTVTAAWYTDRAAVAAIYASTELFMTQDISIGFAETEAFLERRVGEAEGWRKGLSFWGEWVGFQVAGVVGGLRSKGVWI